MAKTNEDIYNELTKITEALNTLITLWQSKEEKNIQGGKKAITTGQHTPMTPEQAYYARLANENKAESSRM